MGKSAKDAKTGDIYISFDDDTTLAIPREDAIELAFSLLDLLLKGDVSEDIEPIDQDKILNSKAKSGKGKPRKNSTGNGTLLN